MKMHVKVEGAPGLYRTPNGYAIRVEVMTTGPNGSVTACRRKSLPGATEAEARLHLERLRGEAEREAGARAKGETTVTTVRAFARLWSEELGRRLKRCSIAPKTVETHVRNLEVFIDPILGRVELAELTPKDVRGWLRDVEQMRMPATRRDRAGGTYKQEPAPYARATLANAWRTLRAFLRWATIEANLPRNPCTEVRWDVEHAPPAKPRPMMEAAEFRAVVGAADAPRDKTSRTRLRPASLRALVLVQGAGALRASELSGLDVEHVDLELGIARVVQSHSEGDLHSPKTIGSRRVVHLPPEAIIALREHLDGRTSGILFPTTTGTRMTPAAINYRLRRLVKDAGIQKQFTSHAVRRTTNNLVRQAAGDLVARAVTGHVTQQMTEHYSSVEREERIAAWRAAFGTGAGATPETV